MDDRRFDSLVKSLAEGANRRSVLKGILGLGGAALAGGTLLEGDADAARRPTPTPKPVKCPGQQTPSGSDCICVSPPAPGTHKCGPDCCTGLPGDPPSPTHSECCDNACCFGTCYGEELCCPTNPGPGEQPPTHKICDTPDGPICIEGTCCNDSECGNGDPCLKCDEETHVCVERCPGDNEVCCTEQAGPGVCVTGECCPGVPCTLASDDDDEDSGICCDGQCLGSDQVCNGGECCPGGFCDGNGDCCAPPSVGCNGGTCCDGFCDANGDCCPAPNVGCNGGVCCDVACDQQGNCPSSCEDQCLYRCGTLETGCDCGTCPLTPSGGPQFCTSNQYCCPGTSLGTNDNCAYCGDVCSGGATCQPNGNDGYVCATPACAPNCDCSDEANDGLDCNGGLAGGGGVCACGFCVVPLDGCPCGCEGDTECVECEGGQCVLINQGQSCNGGDGICDDVYCVAPPV